MTEFVLGSDNPFDFFAELYAAESYGDRWRGVANAVTAGVDAGLDTAEFGFDVSAAGQLLGLFGVEVDLPTVGPAYTGQAGDEVTYATVYTWLMVAPGALEAPALARGLVSGAKALKGLVGKPTPKPVTPTGAPNTTGSARFVAGSDGVVTDLGPRVTPGRPVVIGEDMQGRVIPEAARMGADVYTPPRFESPAQSMAHNRYWINEQMNQGRGIIDVGPAPGRIGFPEPTSPWYAMERGQIASRGYPWYVQRQLFQ